jgi:methylphosphotriester-DNA--protein-cysteine methyltransferase
MFHHVELTKRKLKLLIDNGAINFGGNKPLRIYGALSCRSGKRMKKENRVFFRSEEEAINGGYRPCGHCMKTEYQKWKQQI